jgi:hypothetical protein
MDHPDDDIELDADRLKFGMSPAERKMLEAEGKRKRKAEKRPPEGH